MRLAVDRKVLDKRLSFAGFRGGCGGWMASMGVISLLYIRTSRADSYIDNESDDRQGGGEKAFGKLVVFPKGCALSDCGGEGDRVCVCVCVCVCWRAGGRK